MQGLGVGLFIAATAVLDTIAVSGIEDYINTTTVFYTLFGSAMILMYMFSLLQHALTNFRAKAVFNRLSHVFTFLVIGFCYSVYTITKIQGIKGWILFSFVWLLVIIGILFYAIAGRRHEKLNIILCAIAGFSGIVMASRLYDVLPAKSFAMLAFGGLFYLLGLIFYNIKKVAYMHLISNILMLIGSVYVFFSLFFLNI